MAHSEETKRKIGIANKGKTLGRKFTEDVLKKRSESLKIAHKNKKWGFKNGENNCDWTGKKHKQETKDKIRAAILGKNPMHNPDVVKKRSETLIKNKTFAKENSNNWQGGITPINMSIRSSTDYMNWRKDVFVRDNYTCMECGNRSKKDNPVILEAHHIKPFATHPELRFDINNGITLCRACHTKKPKGTKVYE